MKASFFTVITILFLTSCTTATGPIFQKHTEISNTESIMYVYRPLSFDGATLCFNVFVNEEEKGCLGTSGYISVHIKPGINKIKLKAAAVTLEFSQKFEPEKAYYFEYQLNPNTQNALASQWVAVLGGTNHIIIGVPENNALAKLGALKLSQ